MDLFFTFYFYSPFDLDLCRLCRPGLGFAFCTMCCFILQCIFKGIKSAYACNDMLYALSDLSFSGSYRVAQDKIPSMAK